jgi:hypothetical protein
VTLSGYAESPKVADAVIEAEVVEHTGKGFHVVKHRWKVERSHL